VASAFYKRPEAIFLKNQNWVLEFSFADGHRKTNDSAFEISG
jgi:hypothetical protein